MKSGYELYNTDIISKSENKRICCYFVVSDLHKIAPADIRIKTDELIEEIDRHENWILESVVWDANHKVDTNRDGLNIILEKAKKDEFDILLLHHVTAISHQGGKTFDYVLQLQMLGRSIYGITDEIHSFADLAETLQLSASRKKLYETLKKQNTVLN